MINNTCTFRCMVLEYSSSYELLLVFSHLLWTLKTHCSSSNCKILSMFWPEPNTLLLNLLHLKFLPYFTQYGPNQVLAILSKIVQEFLTKVHHYSKYTKYQPSWLILASNYFNMCCFIRKPVIIKVATCNNQPSVVCSLICFNIGRIRVKKSTKNWRIQAKH